MKIYNSDQIDRLSEILNNDGIISVPTDTIYGVCARINSKKAHDKLVKAKNRPNEKLFPIMCSNIEQIKEIAIINETAEKIIKNFMPGPITIILNKRPELPEYINNGKETIAIRMATSNIIEELINKVGCPLFMSSANRSGNEPCNTIEEIQKEIPLLDGILEGEISFGIGSTIIDCTSKEIKIIRQGPIELKTILEAI